MRLQHSSAHSAIIHFSLTQMQRRNCWFICSNYLPPLPVCPQLRPSASEWESSPAFSPPLLLPPPLHLHLHPQPSLHPGPVALVGGGAGPWRAPGRAPPPAERRRSAGTTGPSREAWGGLRPHAVCRRSSEPSRWTSLWREAVVTTVSL